MRKPSEKVTFFFSIAFLGIQNLCHGQYTAAVPYPGYCNPLPCVPWHCCIPGPNITTPRTTTTTTTIPPITTQPSNPVAPCLPVCGVCPTYGTPTVTTAPVGTNTRICPYTGRVIGRKRRSTTQRGCALNSQCPQGSMCCFDGCSGGRVCKREVPRNTSIAYDTAWGNPRPQVTVSLVMTSGSRSAAWFIGSQLLPIYFSLRNFIQIELIPFGLIHQNGACQYGPADCYGNWVVSCSAKYFMNALSTLNFTACLMQYSWVLQGEKLEDVLSVSKMCMEHEERGTQVWREVSECIKRAEGYQLFLAAGRRQAQIAPYVREVPAVALNGVLVITHPSHLYYFPSILCRMLVNFHEANFICKQILGQ